MISPDEKSDIAAAVQVLRKGGVILYPTDTIWGIGCDATNPEAVARVYSIKQRSDAKALITLMPSAAMLERYVDGIPEVAYQLVELATTPVTVIYDKALPPIAPNLTADDGSLAVRIPLGSPFCMALCKAFGRPLVSTSANISGQPAPALFAGIDPAVTSAVDYVCATGRDDSEPRRPSSIIRIHADGSFSFIRK